MVYPITSDKQRVLRCDEQFNTLLYQCSEYADLCAALNAVKSFYHQSYFVSVDDYEQITLLFSQVAQNPDSKKWVLEQIELKHLNYNHWFLSSMLVSFLIPGFLYSVMPQRNIVRENFSPADATFFSLALYIICVLTLLALINQPYLNKVKEQKREIELIGFFGSRDPFTVSEETHVFSHEASV